MTDTADIQISAFIDDELSREECEFLVRRLGRDTAARRKALRFAVIGAAMRAELLAPDPDVLRRRIGAALEGVHLPTYVERGERGWLGRMTRPALGAAIAASVAVAAVIVVSGRSGVGEPVTPQLASTPAAREATMASGGLAPSFVAPASSSTQSAIMLTDYIVEHNQFTSAMRRASINSTVVGEQHQWRIVPASQSLE